MIQLEGAIYAYNSNGCIAFKNTIESENTVVLVGGLGDNILTLPYMKSLNDYCIRKGISLIIPQLRSMPLYYLAPIESDTGDLRDLVSTLSGSIALIGHSTGCNDILLFLDEYRPKNIKCAVLQGPVSDTESVSRTDINAVLERIQKGNEKYVELENHSIWLKERFISLFSIRGKEDLFSSYLDDSAFAKWKTSTQILSVLSGQDEYCRNPPTEKFKMMGDVYLINSADHCLTSIQTQNEFLDSLDEFFLKTDFLHN